MSLANPTNGIISSVLSRPIWYNLRLHAIHRKDWTCWWPQVPDLKASSNSVFHLAQIIPSHFNHLFFDNWFTSLPLIQHLANRGILCCGTVRMPWLHGIQGKDDKSLMRKGKGSHEEMVSSNTGKEVTYVKWYDNSVMHMVSIFAKAIPVSMVSRYDCKTSKKIEVPCPDIIKCYNRCIRGVDMADCLIA